MNEIDVVNLIERPDFNKFSAILFRDSALNHVGVRVIAKKKKAQNHRRSQGGGPGGAVPPPN